MYRILTWLFPPKNWVPNREVHICPCCDRQFTCWLRRHHCRTCYRCVCNDCSTPEWGSARICVGCRAIEVCTNLLIKCGSNLMIIPREENTDSTLPIDSKQNRRALVTHKKGIKVYAKYDQKAPVDQTLPYKTVLTTLEESNTGWFKHESGWSPVWDEDKHKLYVIFETTWRENITTCLMTACATLDFQRTGSLNTSTSIPSKIMQAVVNNQKWAEKMANVIGLYPMTMQGFWFH